jgi:hypothetical protein
MYRRSLLRSQPHISGIASSRRFKRLGLWDDRLFGDELFSRATFSYQKKSRTDQATYLSHGNYWARRIGWITNCAAGTQIC